MSDTAVILLVGSLVATSCALVGTFLVLRKMALLGDAISHAVLPGIVIAFFLSGGREPIPMVLGAGALGLLTVFFVELLHRTGRMYEDASIGVVFPALFSVGVVLVSKYARAVHLDLDCVLYGEIAYAPLDRLYLGETYIGPKGVWVMGAVLLVNLFFVVFFYKELKIATFDPALATALGFLPGVMHYLLMSTVSLTVVGAFESVGAILVVAMLVVPPAAAHLLTDRLGAMLLLSVGYGLASTFLGYEIARAFDVSIAGGMASAVGLLFGATFVFSPRYGVFAARLHRRRLAERLSGNLLLLHLRKHTPPVAYPDIARQFGWSIRRVRAAGEALVAAGLAEMEPAGIRPTPAGLEAVSRADAEGVPVHAIEGAPAGA